MRPDESTAIFTELNDAFPHLSKRFTWAPRVVTEWTKALRPLSPRRYRRASVAGFTPMTGSRR